MSKCCLTGSAPQGGRCQEIGDVLVFARLEQLLLPETPWQPPGRLDSEHLSDSSCRTRPQYHALQHRILRPGSAPCSRSPFSSPSGLVEKNCNVTRPTGAFLLQLQYRSPLSPWFKKQHLPGSHAKKNNPYPHASCAVQFLLAGRTSRERGESQRVALRWATRHRCRQAGK